MISGLGEKVQIGDHESTRVAYIKLFIAGEWFKTKDYFDDNFQANKVADTLSSIFPDGVDWDESFIRPNNEGEENPLAAQLQDQRNELTREQLQHTSTKESLANCEKELKEALYQAAKYSYLYGKVREGYKQLNRLGLEIANSNCTKDDFNAPTGAEKPYCDGCHHLKQGFGTFTGTHNGYYCERKPGEFIPLNCIYRKLREKEALNDNDGTHAVCL